MGTDNCCELFAADRATLKVSLLPGTGAVDDAVAMDSGDGREATG
jgi:hypothetical protein